MHKYSEWTLLAIVGVVFSPMNCNRAFNRELCTYISGFCPRWSGLVGGDHHYLVSDLY